MAAPPPPPTPGGCSLWLPKKLRYCRFPSVDGFEFCGHHLASRGDSELAKDQQRIPCPLDPSHSIFAKDLQKHLKVCPRAKENAAMAALPYFERDVNRGEPEAAPASAASAANPAAASAAGAAIHRSLNAPRERQLAAVDTNELLALLRLVRAAHGNAAESVRPDTADTDGPATDGAPASAKRQKHALQNERMVSVMSSLGLTSGLATHVEFGAGKGALSAAVSEASLRPPRHVLVDLIKPHGSVDPALVERGATCMRLKCDIAHLRLRGVPGLWSPTPPAAAPAAAAPAGPASSSSTEAATEECVPCEPSGDEKWSAIGKHLCGAATDFTLRCLVTAADGGGEGERSRARRALMDGVVVATCCHHRCEWRSYVNQQFFVDLGFTPEQFGTLCVLSSWATGYRGAPRGSAEQGAAASPASQAGAPEAGAGNADEHAPADSAATLELERSLGDQLSAAERVELGLACKRLLDTGRLRYLARHGYRGWLQHYVPETVSPENTLLIAVPKARD